MESKYEKNFSCSKLKKRGYIFGETLDVKWPIDTAMPSVVISHTLKPKLFMIIFVLKKFAKISGNV